MCQKLMKIQPMATTLTRTTGWRWRTPTATTPPTTRLELEQTGQTTTILTMSSITNATMID